MYKYIKIIAVLEIVECGAELNTVVISLFPLHTSINQSIFICGK